MNLLQYISDKEKRNAWLREFREWQQKPYEVAPLSETTHECSSCKTVFQGNYCPRCGQSARIGRFSFNRAILHFLDVWGMGNRSMFRTIRDLILRPGYMIRDYLSGMQSAYFPPFKMFFLLMAFSLLVEHGIDLSLDETDTQDAMPKVEQKDEEKPADDSIGVAGSEMKGVGAQLEDKEEQNEKNEDQLENKEKMNENIGTLTINGDKVESPMFYYGLRFGKIMNKLRDKNPAIFALLTLMIFSLPLYLFFRRCPNVPDLRFSELVVALVYTSNTFSIYYSIGILLHSGIIKLLAVLMVFVSLRQYSGYSKSRLLAFILLAFLTMVVILGAIGLLGIYITYLFAK